MFNGDRSSRIYCRASLKFVHIFAFLASMYIREKQKMQENAIDRS
ncbi:hypothetical protein DB41_CU00020 [Neochlamydia sp. TUME1]|nr:hypothetical protein DB41_CU00020 [Neochlamydia sp. TUME1]